MGACFTRATDHAWKTTKRFCSLFYSLSLSLLRPNFMSKNMCPQCNRHNNHFTISFVRRKFMDHERKKKLADLWELTFCQMKICLSWSGQVKRICFVAIIWLLNIASMAPVMARNCILWEAQKMWKSYSRIKLLTKNTTDPLFRW